MASDVASPNPRSKLHSLVRLSGPFLGADLPPAERRAQVLSRMPLAAPARSAGSSWTRPSTALCLSRLVGHPSKTATPNHVLPVIPGDRNELVECHSEANAGSVSVSPDRPTKIVLRRSVESALAALVGIEDFRSAIARERFRERFDAKIGVERVGEAPGEHRAAHPVHDHHQV